MFVPTVVALAAVVAFPFHAWRAALRAVWLTLGVGALLGLSVLVTGTKALKGVTSTTTNRAEGDTPLWTLLHDSGLWIGPVFLLALYGTFAYTRRARTEEQNTGPFEPFPAAGEGQAAKWWRLALGVLLTATALLPVAYQVHLQTHVSLHKHVGFGLLFAAPMAGIGLTRILGEHFRRPHLGVAVWCVVAVLGLSQGKALFTWWPDSGKAVQSVRPYLKPDGHYLSDVVEVPVYYLGSQTRPTQWTTPYFFQYRDRSGAVLSGDPAYREAVRDGWFDVILFDNDTSGFNTALTPVIRESGNYRLRASLPQPGRAGTYFIWVRS
jgi:hypothetical protein